MRTIRFICMSNIKKNLYDIIVFEEINLKMYFIELK